MPSTMIKPIGPEDIEPRMYVCEFERSMQYIDCGESYRGPQVRSLTIRAWNAEPLRVRAVCLPYVFVRTPERSYRTIDTRAVTLVRVPDNYARCVVESLRAKRRRKRKRRKK